MLRTLFASAALTLAVACHAPAFAADSKVERTITVSGHGEARVVPDLAIVSIGVLSQSATAAQALAANSTAMQTIFDALKTAGIAAKDIQTSNFTVQPRYQYNNDGKPPLLDGYDVSNTVTVTVRKLDSLGNVLDKAVSAGSNQINGIQFQVSKPETAEDEARKLAVEDAHRKAMIYAKAGNVALGDIASISEGGGFEPPVPMLRAKAMSADGTSSAPPIAGGEQALGIDVNIVWVIK